MNSNSSEGKKRKTIRIGETVEIVLADIVARLLWFVVFFVGTMFFCLGGSRSVHVPTGNLSVPLIFSLVVGILAFAFGPQAYASATQRGRGKLQEIRERSKMKK